MLDIVRPLAANKLGLVHLLLKMTSTKPKGRTRKRQYLACTYLAKIGLFSKSSLVVYCAICTLILSVVLIYCPSVFVS